MDFDHVPEGEHPNVNRRLYVDDKESYYRYDRLPTVSPLDEEPTGVQWNHPGEKYHKTTVWSGNGCLYIERVNSEVVVDRYGNVVGGHHAPPAIIPAPAPEMDFGPAIQQAYNPVQPTTDSGDCGTCGQNVTYG